MRTSKPLLSIVIASYNQGHLITDTVQSCLRQYYSNKEIIIYDDASTDHTEKIVRSWVNSEIRYYRGNYPSGSGGAFNRAMSYADGEYILLLCADDLLTNPYVVDDVVKLFEEDKTVGHITRFYHQFISGDRRPVRAWRTYDPIEQANNPSGLAFRSIALLGKELTNKMFVEAPTLVYEILKAGWKYDILEYDTVAVRIHNSTARNKDYYVRMWKSSPVEEWNKINGKGLLNDFTSLIQIKNYFTTYAVLKECWNFIKLKPLNLINPAFWFFSTIALTMPRCILRNVPDWYRRTLGRWFTKEVKREP